MQYFYIKEGSVNNPLRIELIDDGNYGYIRDALFNNAIQNADVVFSMYDEDGILKVSNGKCDIINSECSNCNERCIIEYKWKKRDTNKKGKYFGKFEIFFNDDIYEENVKYPNGNLIVPIYEDLIIMVK